MILVIDVGTTGLRAAPVFDDATVGNVEYRPLPPQTPFPGLVEFDPAALAATALEAARAVLAAHPGTAVAAVGIANQRASTLMWDRRTGEPVGTGLGWQDLRTIGECIAAKAEHGMALAPNQSATKMGWLLANAAAGRSAAELCVGTIDSWLAWTLTGGRQHVTDHSNAAVTGLFDLATRSWSNEYCSALGIPVELLPEIVATSGPLAAASALGLDAPLAALVGDQQASLAGQRCVVPGRAKITFGTGGMLDLCTGAEPPESDTRSPDGTFPIVAWSQAGDDGPQVTWGVEAIMLSAGSNVEWLCEDLGVIGDPADSHLVASRCDTSDGVIYVPALLGLGTPRWDYGARGTLLGLTRGSRREHVVRAVLEGVAQRGADLVEAAERHTGLRIETLRVDGGMSRNPTFVQALADATARPVEVAALADSTTLGAGLHAGVAVGVWPDLAATESLGPASARVEPTGAFDRAAWQAAVERSAGWIPELSALDF